MRKWSPAKCDNGEKGGTVYQIMIPTVHRREVLGLVHDLPMSGHLQHFYWPGLKKKMWQSGARTATLAS